MRTTWKRDGDVLKRAFDMAAASAGLLLLSPVMLGTALVIKRKMGGPVLFRQVRPGLDGEPFELYKFRTMTDARDASGALLPDAARMTAAGERIRRWSLDELPQLINVVRGDLSLVGPRPLLMQYLPLYDSEQMRQARSAAGHHRVGPGQWTEQPVLAGEVRTRRVVRRQSDIHARPQDTPDDRHQGHQKGGHQPGGREHNEGIYRK